MSCGWLSTPPWTRRRDSKPVLTPPKPWLPPLPGADEFGIAERILIDLVHRNEDIAVVFRPKAPGDKERIVAGAVGPILRGEGGRQLVLVRLEVIPVRQGPVGPARPAVMIASRTIASSAMR